ncbi:protein VAC14 homolog isoform X1 [Tasmannia lanceolata]|uniref:protein VAC14 homolog isoform X1 n=1 Tax=Tasmannia lanceolata TaxID=3420 RepID=UPI004062E302
MLRDSSHEIRQQADSAVSEFLQEIKDSPSVDYGRMAEILVQRAASSTELTLLTAITWINEFVKLGGDQLVPYYADILGAILPCISDKEEKIRVVARKTNEELRAIRADPAEGFDVGAILSIARQLSSEMEATRIEALHLIATLLARHRTEVISFLDDIFGTLLKALSDPSDEVIPFLKFSYFLIVPSMVLNLGRNSKVWGPKPNFPEISEFRSEFFRKCHLKNK